MNGSLFKGFSITSNLVEVVGGESMFNVSPPASEITELDGFIKGKGLGDLLLLVHHIQGLVRMVSLAFYPHMAGFS